MQPLHPWPRLIVLAACLAGAALAACEPDTVASAKPCIHDGDTVVVRLDTIDTVPILRICR